MNAEESDRLWTSKSETLIAKMLLDPVSALALELLRTHPLVAGKSAGEDSSGRTRLELQTAEETVNRCFDLAEFWYAKAKARSPGPIPTRTEAAESDGRIIRARNRQEFSREPLPETT